VISSS